MREGQSTEKDQGAHAAAHVPRLLGQPAFALAPKFEYPLHPINLTLKGHQGNEGGQAALNVAWVKGDGPVLHELNRVFFVVRAQGRDFLSPLGCAQTRQHFTTAL